MTKQDDKAKIDGDYPEHDMSRLKAANEKFLRLLIKEYLLSRAEHKKATEQCKSTTTPRD